MFATPQKKTGNLTLVKTIFTWKRIQATSWTRIVSVQKRVKVIGNKRSFIYTIIHMCIYIYSLLVISREIQKIFTCLLENEIYQHQQKHTVNFESFRSIFNQPVVMSSGCPGSQLEVLYSQIKVAIFQPCERRARPQMETSFSGGLY